MLAGGAQKSAPLAIGQKGLDRKLLPGSRKQERMSVDHGNQPRQVGQFSPFGPSTEPGSTVWLCPRCGLAACLCSVTVALPDRTITLTRDGWHLDMADPSVDVGRVITRLRCGASHLHWRDDRGAVGLCHAAATDDPAWRKWTR